MISGVDTTYLVQVSVVESPGHSAARDWLDAALRSGEQSLAMAPQVLMEFMHVVTDPRRFQRPLTMGQALARARSWWEAREVKPVYPTLDSTRLALQWQQEHRLGRKRLLDTQLAATYHAAGITQLLTTNRDDFAIFGVFQFVPGV